MTWDVPQGPGLEMAPLRTPGNRWSVQQTDDLLTAWTHAEVARRQGRPISVLGPVLNARAAVALAAQRPFAAAVPATYNLQLFQPLFQQVVMQRQHIDARRLGTIAAGSLFRTSEVCHFGMVAYTANIEVFDFYERALGLTRTTQRRFPYDPDSPASEMFALQPGEAFTEIDFDDPRAGLDPAHSLAGRLRIFAVESLTPASPRVDASPGQLGYSLYTVRTDDIGTLRQAVIVAGAARVTPILSDEVGGPAFSFRAPDGYAWTAVGGPPS
jgi:catechol 2,3-dioxygenase-like lactoylglutathione lyase family enzyme